MKIDQRIRLRDRITGQEFLLDVFRAQELMREQMPAALGVGGRYEQLYNPAWNDKGAER